MVELYTFEEFYTRGKLVNFKDFSLFDKNRPPCYIGAKAERT
jgi:hypothetical protein